MKDLLNTLEWCVESIATSTSFWAVVCLTLTNNLIFSNWLASIFFAALAVGLWKARALLGLFAIFGAVGSIGS